MEEPSRDHANDATSEQDGVDGGGTRIEYGRTDAILLMFRHELQ